jgi:hypothetical protein
VERPNDRHRPNDLAAEIHDRMPVALMHLTSFLNLVLAVVAAGSLSNILGPCWCYLCDPAASYTAGLARRRGQAHRGQYRHAGAVEAANDAHLVGMRRLTVLNLLAHLRPRLV